MTRLYRAPLVRAIALLAALLLTLFFLSPWLLQTLGNALVFNQPPQKADAVLVLAGDSIGNRILKGARLVRQGYAPLVYASGPSGNYGFTEDQLAIRFATERGFPSEYFVGLPNKAESTLDEARILLPILKAKGVRRLLLVTSNFHTARAARIFRRTGPEFEITVIAAQDNSFTPDAWWHTRQGQKIVFFEATKTLADFIGL